MLPAASPAIQSILATLDLATKFAFVIVVGPDEYPELARWSLAVHLAVMGQEVLWHSLADSDLDLPSLLERASSANPVVIASGIEDLSPELRQTRFARMNLARDVWGQYPIRVVLWCSAGHIDRFQHSAADLFHWRSLIQPISAPDLCVFDRTTYLAWLADDCAERSDDRVLRGGHMLLRNPLLLPLTAEKTASGEMIPFSRWASEHRHGLLLRSIPQDSRYPAKEFVRHLALRRLNGLDGAFPVLLTASQLSCLAPMTLPSAPVEWRGEGWNIVEPDVDTTIFVIDDGSAPQDPSTSVPPHERARWIVITDHGEAWSACLPTWPQAIAMAIIDPLSIRGSASDTFQALAALLRELFAPPTFLRFLAMVVDQPFAQSVADEPEGALQDVVERAIGRLLAKNRITTKLFDDLRALRPRQWRDINRVEQMFIDLDLPDRPASASLTPGE